MTRFIYLADSHCCAHPPGYQQQKAYTELLSKAVAALQTIVAEEEIEFVLHGGDLIDFTNEENIRHGAELFEPLGVPVYLCLGNHDLTTPDSLPQWLKLAPQLFPGAKPEFSIVREDCSIHVAPNHWGEYSYYWKDSQKMRFDAKQLAFLKTALFKHTDRPHLLLTHGPTFGLPPQQTGFDAGYHVPNPGFTQTITDLAAKHPHLRCVLGAHNHLNSCGIHQGTQYVTTSAFVETPFEVKLFDVTRDSLTMSTLSLGNRIAEKTEYNFDKTFVQGRLVDRRFVWQRNG